MLKNCKMFKIRNMKNKILLTISFLASVLILNSCLKDDVGEDWTSSLKGKMYAEIWNPGFQALGLQPVPDEVTFKFLVNIATDQPPKEDITLTIGVDDDARIAYNALKGTNYSLFPNIEVLNPTLVIKAGTRNAYCHVKVWGADALDACDNFMAPIAITGATGGVIISPPLNNGARLMALPIANPYAGSYHTVGYRIRPGNAAETVDQTEQFSTINCKTVSKVGFGNYTTFSIRIEITSDIINVAGTDCFKVIATPYDPTTGDPTGGMFDTWTGDISAPPAPPADPTWINYYNPVTKVFVLNCYYEYTGVPNRIMYEVHTRI
jgi:hypothetical protein